MWSTFQNWKYKLFKVKITKVAFETGESAFLYRRCTIFSYVFPECVFKPALFLVLGVKFSMGVKRWTLGHSECDEAVHQPLCILDKFEHRLSLSMRINLRLFLDCADMFVLSASAYFSPKLLVHEHANGRWLSCKVLELSNPQPATGRRPTLSTEPHSLFPRSD